MSAIIVILPALPAAWPVITAAAAAAASALGFAAARTKQEAEAVNEAEVSLQNSEAVSAQLALGGEVAFTKEGVQVVVFRNTEGRVGVRAMAKGKSEAELREIAQQLANALTQQYAYNQLMEELRSRNFTVVGEDVEADGTVRLRVRTFQG
jgi:hypothetical protein